MMKHRNVRRKCFELLRKALAPLVLLIAAFFCAPDVACAQATISILGLDTGSINAKKGMIIIGLLLLLVATDLVRRSMNEETDRHKKRN